MDYYKKINWRAVENPVLYDPSVFLHIDDVKTTYLTKLTEGNLKLSEESLIEPNSNRECVNVPGEKYYFRNKIVSKFNRNQHAQFINALKIINGTIKRPNFSESKDLELFNQVKVEIAEETAKYIKTAEASWKKTLGLKPMNFKMSLLSYAKFEWEKKLRTIEKLPEHYKEIDLVSYSYGSSDTLIEMKHVYNALDVGKVAKFTPPDMIHPFFLKLSTLPNFHVNIYNSKLPVSQDKNIDNILLNQDVDIVTSLSGLKRLIDFNDYNEVWNMPVVIKEIRTKTEHNMPVRKNVIFIDKPLPKKNPTRIDLNERCQKLMLKTNFCSNEGFTYPEEIYLKGENIEKNSTVASDENCTDDPDEVLTNRTIYHNATYKIWILEQADGSNTMMKTARANRTFKVLVRTKIDGCTLLPSETLQAVTVVPKMEFALSYGAQLSTKSELARQWTSLYFKPFSSLCRVRTQVYHGEVVKIESYSLSELTTEAITKQSLKPQYGLGVLYKVYYELSKWPKGNYLLHHEAKHGAFISLMQESNSKDCFSLHEYYKDASINENYVKPWINLDTTVLLPIFEERGHMPGLFAPCNEATNKYRQHKAGKKSAKKKIKNKKW